LQGKSKEENIILLCFVLFQPQNILLTDEFPKGSVKICDLGFACLVNTGEDIRDIIGTPDYVGMYIQYQLQS
jgi:serine/threonine protein kinase